MKILVTGSKGFVGKNLIYQLKNIGDYEIFEYDKNTKKEYLDEYTKKCNFVFHFAGVNRTENEKEFLKGNFGFTYELISYLMKNKNKAPILYTSSIQAKLDNTYGKSKKQTEDLLFSYSKKTKTKILVYRLTNLFGKWCKPNYNSVVATFCNNIAKGLPIRIDDENKILELAYIDDVVNEFINAMNGNPSMKGIFGYIPITYTIKVQEIADLIESFKNSRESLLIPNVENQFAKKLYSTYLSYLSEDEFLYKVKSNIDDRGSFSELFKTKERGQISLNVIKPGVIKGNHWHNTKCEKFIVVSGRGVIRFRKVDSDKVIEYFVSDEKLEIVDIPVGYTHNVENLGKTDLKILIWANEIFDENKPDTFYLNV